MIGDAPVGVEHRGRNPRVRLRGRALVCSVALALLSVLGGCGGGGGGPVAEPPTVCIPTHGGDCVTRAAFEQKAEALVDGYKREDGFRNQWGLAKIGAGRAYANIEVLKGAGAEPGAGVTIGFLDTGIDRDHPAFAGKTVTERFLPGAADETGSDTVSHGTSVASVAAAGKAASSGAASGVAWGADIAMFAIPFPPVVDGYIPVLSPTLFDAGFPRLFDVNPARIFLIVRSFPDRCVGAHGLCARFRLAVRLRFGLVLEES